MRCIRSPKKEISYLDLSAEKPQIQNQDHILINVKAAGVNRADLLQIKGLYPPPDSSDILGLEVAGIIDGTDKRVCTLVPSGGYADYVSAPRDMLIPIPPNYTFTQAAALPEALMTCWLNLFKIGNIKPHHTILIHCGSSGIGSFAIQCAKSIGANVITTVGDNHKIDFCKKLNADKVLNYKTSSVLNELGNNSVDIIFDILGGRYTSENIHLLKPKGKIISIAFMTGKDSEIDMKEVLTKNISIIGSTLRSKSLQEKIMITQEVITNFYPHIENGNIKPYIDSVYDIENYMTAHERMKSRKHCGKIILET